MARGGGGGVDLWAYRQYLARYAPGTLRSRWMVAGEWTALHPNPSTATHRDVEAWLRDRGGSANTSRVLLGALRAFYRWLLREELVSADPTQLVDGPRVPVRLRRAAPEREVGRLLALDDDPRLRALVALMVCAGLRCCECSALDWSDVDLTAPSVIVYGKGSKERLITLSPDVVRALAALRLAAGGHGAVFVGSTGRRMTAARVSQFVRERLARAGLSGWSAHSLRHRCAVSALMVSNLDLLAVRDLLGHSSVSTTQRYLASMPDRTASTSAKLALPAA